MGQQVVVRVTCDMHMERTGTEKQIDFNIDDKMTSHHFVHEITIDGTSRRIYVCPECFDATIQPIMDLIQRIGVIVEHRAGRKSAIPRTETPAKKSTPPATNGARPSTDVDEVPSVTPPEEPPLFQMTARPTLEEMLNAERTNAERVRSSAAAAPVFAQPSADDTPHPPTASDPPEDTADTGRTGLPYPCLLCDHSFKSSSGINRHLTVTHNVTAEDLIGTTCPLCGKSYMEYKSLASHFGVVHRRHGSSDAPRSILEAFIEAKEKGDPYGVVTATEARFIERCT